MYINVAECKEWKSRVTSYQPLEDQIEDHQQQDDSCDYQDDREE